jgi:hypothetical protein
MKGKGSNLAGWLLCSSASTLLVAAGFSLALPRTWPAMAVAPTMRDAELRRKRRRRRWGAGMAKTRVTA